MHDRLWFAACGTRIANRAGVVKQFFGGSLGGLHRDHVIPLKPAAKQDDVQHARTGHFRGIDDHDRNLFYMSSVRLFFQCQTAGAFLL